MNQLFGVVCLKDFIDFVISKSDKIWTMLVQHCEMVLIALAISIVVGLFIGYLITNSRTAAQIVLYIASIFMTIPSLALFSFLIPIMGLNMTPVIFGLVIYTLLPIIRNTYVGLINIDPAIVDSARGMGLTNFEINFKVRFPLALPVIFAGIRTSVVLGIGIGAIAAYVGAGGLGVYIFQGINRGNMKMLLSAAILIALLTIIIDRLFQAVQKASEKRIS